jgi:large conductance mechanosensitive channel
MEMNKVFEGLKMAKEDEMLMELKKIRELLTKPPPPPPPKGLWNEFMDFLSKYKVMGLAVAFIMGVYLGNLVQALVSNLVMPMIGLAIPGLGNLATFVIPIPYTPLDSAGKPIDPNYVGQLFGVGAFIAALITFIIVAFVIFILVKVTKRWGIE